MLERIEVLKANRFQFLHKCYELSECDSAASLDWREVGVHLGFEEEVTLKTAKYLSDAGLIEF